MSICSICGRMESVSKGLIRDGQFICSDHLEKCVDCGELIFTDKDDYIIVNGDYICESCRDYHYSYCERCEEWHDNDDIVQVYTDSRGNYEYWCEECASNNAYECHECGDYYSADYFSSRDIYGSSADFICDSCVDRYYYYCSDCGCYVHCDDVEEGNDGEYYCPDCVEEHRNTTIHEYGYKPDLVFHGENDEIHFGFELETQGEEYKAGEYLEHFAEGEDVIYLKHDSSIGGGFEIVSQPMTFNFLKNSNFTKEFEDSLEFLRDNSFKSHNVCGFHVHVELDKLSMVQVALISSILYNVADSSEYNKVLAITQRKKSALEDWGSLDIHSRRKQNFDNKADLFNFVIDNQYVFSQRYTGVNVCRDTMELRIFNGNIRTERFYKNIELVKALLDFSKEIEADYNTIKDSENFNLNDYLIKNVNINQLINYVNQYSYEYPNLSAFLKEKGIESTEQMTLERIETQAA